ncbi:MAG: 15-methyltransferase (decarboxylating) [Candidatus Tokpelaia sp. JSC188]|nr:MAG: 15-methyltransferase (decarboxylating) [Candidatus Tokpelaia sp. JSC188]
MRNKINIDCWLTVIGIGEDGLSGLGKIAINRLQEAEFIFGGERHLAFLDAHLIAKGIPWPRPFSDSIEKIKTLKGRKVVLLASGDPIFYGAGATFLRYFSQLEMEIYPHVSSFSLAATRLGWPLQDVECCSVHGRPLSTVFRFLENGARLLILSNDGSTPTALGTALEKKGFGSSRITIMEHLGGAEERIISQEARRLTEQFFADLNLIAVHCVCDHRKYNFSRFSVLPDHAFIHDGQLTKQDIRAVTLAQLAPRCGTLLWDVGAGCGSISVEWMRLGKKTHAVAIEQNSDRCNYIRQNADNLGVPNLEIREGRAPSALQDLKTPDAVFIGGGIIGPNILETCWRALKPGGQLVANVITLESEAIAVRWSIGKQARLLKVAVSIAEPLGDFHVWRQSLPVTMFIIHKT